MLLTKFHPVFSFFGRCKSLLTVLRTILFAFLHHNFLWIFLAVIAYYPLYWKKLQISYRHLISFLLSYAWSTLLFMNLCSSCTCKQSLSFEALTESKNKLRSSLEKSPAGYVKSLRLWEKSSVELLPNISLHLPLPFVIYGTYSLENFARSLVDLLPFFSYAFEFCLDVTDRCLPTSNILRPAFQQFCFQNIYEPLRFDVS
jgi:hypothetical protein